MEQERKLERSMARRVKEINESSSQIHKKELMIQMPFLQKVWTFHDDCPIHNVGFEKKGKHDANI